MSHSSKHKVAGKFVIALMGFLSFYEVKADYQQQSDSNNPKGVDTLRFAIHDRRGDAFSSSSRRSMDFSRPANITDSIVYDSKTKQYYIVEKIGSF